MVFPDARARGQSLAPHATVAILTALPHEQAAVEVMLDNPVPFSTPGNAPGEYWLGTVPSKDGGSHVVVLGRCSAGENLAAANATILFERFPRIETVIMVGIAGAVPDPTKEEADVRLGDIVVCNGDGVVQYDYDKEVLKDGVVKSEPRHPPRPPSARLAAAAEELRTGVLLGRRPWEAHFLRAGSLAWARRPTEPDLLYSAEDPSVVIERSFDSSRQAGMPRVFSGRIASGNKLLKNAKLRERLRSTFGVKAVEMEASGVADASWLQRAGYFVVRGTCDYCDGHKSDVWQGYAAMIAAAYARALLEETRSAGAPHDGKGADTQAASYKPLLSLSRALRDRAVKAAASCEDGGLLLSELDALISVESQVEERFDAAWPSERPWSVLATEALGTVLDAWNADLNFGEQLIALAFPFLVSAAHQTITKRYFVAGSDEANALPHKLFETVPVAESLLERGLPETSERMVIRWAMLRFIDEQRSTWSDLTFRSFSPDVPLARWLAADPLFPTLARVVFGNIAQFTNLPENGTFRFGVHAFDIRWRLLACLLSLSTSRVFGAHVLSPEVVEHAVQLSDVWTAVAAQLRDLSIESDGEGSWVLRATCDEPVFDYAINEIAQHLDSDLRGHRAQLSSYAAQTIHRGFPVVRAEPHPRLVDGHPRYTTPHVSFALAPDHARRLFMGTDLWGDPSFAYRELFQNALDACRYRLGRSRYLNIPYAPAIRMYHGRTSEGREYVECEDNGIGMDRDIVASCFAMAGRRFVNTDEFRREVAEWRANGIDVHTNSQFGIGVFSYFLVADELEIETSRLGVSGEYEPRRLFVRVPTAASFFRIISLSAEEARAAQKERARERGESPSALLDAGTRVRLWLRQPITSEMTGRIGRTVTCVDAIREHVWFSEVPVSVRDYRGHEFKLAAHELAPWLCTSVAAGGPEPSFWWVVKPPGERPDAGQLAEPITTFRSRKRGNDNDPSKYQSFGRVLVDGIVTDSVTPGFIVNLAGSLTPKLSLDRRKIRSDIRGLIEARVHQAIDDIPDEVFEGFLTDLWHWDPRACHKASRVLTEGKKCWLQDATLHWMRADGELPERVTQGYFPPVELDTFVFASYRNYRKTLMNLWKLARYSPDAREQPPFVLEARNVPTEVQRNITNIPQIVWDALGQIELGVPEACAITYGIAVKNSVPIPAYMSWLSGEAVHVCSRRMDRFRQLLDIDWTVPVSSQEYVLSDYDAWLLSHGLFTTPWAGPRINTRDVVLFCSKSGMGLDEAMLGYRRIAEMLGWTVEVDVELARAIGPLRQDELLHVHMLQSGFDRSYLLDSVAPDREAMLARLVDGEVTIRRERRRSPATREIDKVFSDEMLRMIESRNVVDLAALCELSRTIERPAVALADDVRRVADAMGLSCTWSDEDIRCVSEFSDQDWLIVEEPGVWGSSRKKIRPKTRLKLAVLVAKNRYLLGYDKSRAREFLQRLTNVYGLFGWGAVPLTESDIELAASLDSEESSVLDDAPETATFTIPRLIAMTATAKMNLVRISLVLEKLEALGVKGPRSDDSYLGLTWYDILRAASQEKR
ncbi:phosphorylase family protein [Sorangium sp. So ce394]|uniref:5'-methylthioadenosine/S-adenosylhomocysteine nucleosidase n=1 Tax=Sorangium sp. So ce394 TaxID=3133310 RepID=UPI003F5B797B